MPAADEAATTESLGQQLRTALPPMRLHSISLHDLEGDVLWLSQGALGPDEHGFVSQALGSLRGDPASIYREDEFEDGRAALFLAIRTPQSQLAGLVMILVDAKASGAGKVAARVLTPPVREILRKLALRLSPPPPTPVALATAPKAAAPKATPPNAMAAGPPAARATTPRTATPVTESAVTPSGATRRGPLGEGTPPARGGAKAAKTLGSATPKSISHLVATPLGSAIVPTLGGTAATTLGSMVAGMTSAVPVLEPARIDELLTLQLEDSEAAMPPLSLVDTSISLALSQPVPEPRRSVPTTRIGLHVQELARLRSGGRTRRFQLIPASGPTHAGDPAHAGGAPDANPTLATGGGVHTVVATLQELTAWLLEHRKLQEQVPLSFYVPIGGAAIIAEELPDAIAECVQPAHIRAGSIGFQIGEAMCMRHRVQAERLIRKFETLGCALVLDDFTFDSGALELLRSKVLRLVKVNPGLTSGVLRDRLTQARVVAILNAAKVLGIHCSAKRVEDRVICRWLARAGFEYAEGSLFDGPRPLSSLGAQLVEAE